MKKKLAIIGNGVGTCRLLDELVLRGGSRQFEITVFGEERGGAYNRILLSRVLSGEAPDNIVTKVPEWYDRHGIRLTESTRVTRIDTLRKNVEIEGGQSRRYDIAVMATGSKPWVPPLDGMLAEDGELRAGVFAYRNMADCIRMRNFARAGDSAIVIGGGLLGLEAAKVLSDRGLHVTIVHLPETLLNAQVDPIAGDMLRRRIERFGIFVRTGRTVESLYGDGAVEGVVLDDGTRLSADMVVLACGVRPRVDVAQASGLPVRSGILVNDTLATQVPGVYAFGECAEHRGRTYGIASPVWEQAAVLADVLTGVRPQARYRGSKVYTRLKVAGVDVASMGTLEPELEGDQVMQIVEERRDTYRKIVIREGRVVGAMLVGNTTATATLVQLFDRGDPMPDDPLELFARGLPSGPAAERIVCNCHKVTEGVLREAVANGADSVAALGATTKAGTGCGSCKGELAQLVATSAKKGPSLPLAS